MHNPLVLGSNPSGPTILSMLRKIWYRLSSLPIAWTLVILLSIYVVIMSFVLTYYKDKSNAAEAQLAIMQRLVENRLK